MSELVRVRMLGHYLNNSPGDECGYSPDVAAKLIDGGVAIPLGSAPPLAAPKSAPAPASTGGEWQGEGEEEPAAAAMATPAAPIPEGWRKQAPAPKK